MISIVGIETTQRLPIRVLKDLLPIVDELF
jgi:hypothetical protein